MLEVFPGTALYPGEAFRPQTFEKYFRLRQINRRNILNISRI